MPLQYYYLKPIVESDNNMDKIIVVHLWGGIGNQLFIYSFGEYLRNRYNVDVYYDLSSYGTTDIRNLEINTITDKLPEYKTRWFFFTRHIGLFRRISRTLFQALPRVYYTNNVFNENILEKNYKLLYFDGYWQDRKYADSMLAQKAEMYKPALPLPEVISKYESVIKNKYTVSVHIRRGDYLQSQNAHLNVCTKAYYEKAVGKFKNDKDITFVVFSDDLEWVKENLDFGEKAIYVDDEGGSPYWDIYLMSKCTHHIISNSTFSWWGAFLNPNKNKKVIAPAKWRNDKQNPPLYYPEWELVS